MQFAALPVPLTMPPGIPNGGAPPPDRRQLSAPCWACGADIGKRPWGLRALPGCLPCLPEFSSEQVSTLHAPTTMGLVPQLPAVSHQNPLPLPYHPFFLSFHGLSCGERPGAPLRPLGYSRGTHSNGLSNSRGTQGVVEGYSSCTQGALKEWSRGTRVALEGHLRGAREGARGMLKGLCSTGPRQALGGTHGALKQ